MIALTRSLRSLRLGELTVLRAPAEPALFALTLSGDSRKGAAFGGACGRRYLAPAGLDSVTL